MPQPIGRAAENSEGDLGKWMVRSGLDWERVVRSMESMLVIRDVFLPFFFSFFIVVNNMNSYLSRVEVSNTMVLDLLGILVRSKDDFGLVKVVKNSKNNQLLVQKWSCCQNHSRFRLLLIKI